MNDHHERIPSHFIFIAMMLAAFLTSLPPYILLRLAFPDDTSHDPLSIFIGVFMMTVLATLLAGLPLALVRLRDPDALITNWAMTGALGGLLGGVGFNVLILCAHLFGGAIERLPLLIIGVFIFAAAAGALVAVIARTLTLRFLGNR